MLISNSSMSSLGSMSRNPLVGLGVVGRNMFLKSALLRCCNSPFVSLVRNPMAQIPLRGYCTSTVFLKTAFCWVENVSMICLTVL